MARYCSTACQVLVACVRVETRCSMCCLTLLLPQRQAWCVHRLECKCLRSLLPRVPTDSVRLSARIIFALVRHPLANTQSGVSRTYIFIVHIVLRFGCFLFEQNPTLSVLVSSKHIFVIYLKKTTTFFLFFCHNPD